MDRERWTDAGNDGHVEEGLRRAAAEFWPHLIERAMAVNCGLFREPTLEAFREQTTRLTKPERAASTPSANLRVPTMTLRFKPSSGYKRFQRHW